MQKSTDATRSDQTKRANAKGLTRFQKAKFLLNLLDEQSDQASFAALKLQLNDIVAGSPEKANQSDPSYAANQLLKFANPTETPGKVRSRAPHQRAHEAKGSEKPALVSLTAVNQIAPSIQQESDKNGEHPAIIARRLLPLSVQSRKDSLSQLPGDVARQVRFLIWKFEGTEP